MFTVPSPFFESLPDEYVAFDAQGRYTWVSDRTARRLGLTRESMIGQSVTALFPTAGAFRQVLDQVLSTREPLDVEMSSTVLNSRVQLRAYPTPDGVEVYFKAAPDTLDARHDAARMIALITVLNGTNDLGTVIGSVMDYLGDGVYGALVALRDHLNAPLTLSHRAGYRDQPHRPLPALSGPLLAFLEDVTRTRKLTAMPRDRAQAQFPGLILDTATAQLIAVPLVVTGRVLGVLLLSLRDATPPDVVAHSRLSVLAGQCAAAIDRARAYAQAQHDRARFRTLLEATNAILLELDADLRVQRPMPTWEAFTGQTFEEYRDRGYLRAVHPDERDGLVALLDAHVTAPVTVHVTGRLQAASGGYRDVAAQVVPVTGPDGHLTTWMGTVRDVTDARRRDSWARRTQEIMLAVGRAQSAQDTYDTVLGEVTALLGTDRGVLCATLRPGDPFEVLAVQGVPDALRPGVIQAMQGQRVPTAKASPAGIRWCRDVPEHLPALATLLREDDEVLAMPFSVSGHLVGEIYAVCGRTRRPGPDVTAFVETLQPRLVQVIQRAHLLSTLERSEHDAQAILATLDEGILVVDGHGVDGHGQVVATNDALYRLTRVPVPMRRLADLFAADTGMQDADGQPLPPAQHPAARALATGEAIRSEVVQHVRPGAPAQWLSVTATPLRRDGHVARVVVSMTDVTESVLIERQLERLALEDDLTGPPNRRAVMRVLADVQRQPQGRRALLLIDIDGFKLINDAYGQARGDTLLRAVAGRLRRVTDGALLARLAGDEFCVLVAEHGDTTGAALADTVLGAMARPFVLDGMELQVGVSVGVSVSGVSGTGPGDLYRNASLALIEARAQGGGRCSEYTESHGDAHIRRMLVERRLRTALAHRDVSVVYQPIVTLAAPDALAFEVLARWHDTELGMVSPAEFIPVAETTGLIHDLGVQVLALALRQCAEWTRTWGVPVGVSVNVSASQFMRPAFLDALLDQLRLSRVPPAQLTLEVTEAVAIHSLDDVIRQLQAIREVGVRIALDDFGTGFSSLAVLERLPIDVLKLDRALVAGVHRSPRRLELLTAVLLIAQRLALTVVAEGVEDTEELDMLRQLGCDRVQGYLISRPQPASGFTGPGPGHVPLP